MTHFSGYQCSLCTRQYNADENPYTCACGGNLDVILDYAAIRAETTPWQMTEERDPSLWRYHALLPARLPFNGQETPLGAAGGTPIFALNGLARQLGLKHLWLKDESRNPSASFKDRASALIVARAREINAEVVVTASTGNAGAALACMAAAIGQKAVIFAPKSAPPAKIAQLLVFGAQVLLVDGNYDAAFDLSVQAAREFGWYCRNTGYNPFTAEGKKTAAFEIWEWGLHNIVSADKLTIFISVGDGNIISGVHKGFKDLLALGWLDAMPRIVGVQAQGSAAIANAFHAQSEQIVPVAAQTLADSISVDLPRDGVRAVRAARETNGTYITVSDEEILGAIATLGSAGILAEPASAAAFAGLQRAARDGSSVPLENVLVLHTGSGLKDVRAAMQSVSSAPIIEPTLQAVKKIVNA
jgi:threonine synthase